jgi:SAM-dependent methyltransferase
VDDDVGLVLAEQAPERVRLRKVAVRPAERNRLVSGVPERGADMRPEKPTTPSDENLQAGCECSWGTRSTIAPVPDPRTQIVSDGYDAMGDVFAEWRTRIAGDPRREWEEELASRLTEGARVLELGCGSGSPETKRLAERFRLTGVDISPRQVERARAAVPGAEFLCADFTELDLPAGSFDAVASFISFNHVPRDLLAPLLERIHRCLVPDGLLLTAFGVSDIEGWTGEWLGAETFFSSYPADTNSRLVREAGFRIERDEVITFEEPEGPASFQWVLAQA